MVDSVVVEGSDVGVVVTEDLVVVGVVVTEDLVVVGVVLTEVALVELALVVLFVRGEMPPPLTVEVVLDVVWIVDVLVEGGGANGVDPKGWTSRTRSRIAAIITIVTYAANIYELVNFLLLFDISIAALFTF